MIQEGDLDRDHAVALAVARVIAAERAGGAVEIRGIPEREDRTNKVVELVTSDAVGTLALEHTLIEPYPGQIRDGYRIRPYEEALPAILGNRLPVDSRFDLCFGIGAVDGIEPSREVLEATAAWVIDTAPLLVDGRPGVAGAHMSTAGLPDVPFPLTLVRWPSSLETPGPRVTLRYWRPDDLEKRRIERLGRALGGKLPKLNAAANGGHERVLVVESADIQFSNTIAIECALRSAALAVNGPLPEWIVLWQEYGDMAFVSVLRSGDSWIDDPEPSRVAAIPRGRDAHPR